MSASDETKTPTLEEYVNPPSYVVDNNINDSFVYIKEYVQTNYLDIASDLSYKDMLMLYGFLLGFYGEVVPELKSNQSKRY